jgi:hypothetical protein
MLGRRPATGRGGVRNRMLARLPKQALASNRKVLPSIGAFSRTMSAPGRRRHTSAEEVGHLRALFPASASAVAGPLSLLPIKNENVFEPLPAGVSSCEATSHTLTIPGYYNGGRLCYLSSLYAADVNGVGIYRRR